MASQFMRVLYFTRFRLVKYGDSLMKYLAIVHFKSRNKYNIYIFDFHYLHLIVSCSLYLLVNE